MPIYRNATAAGADHDVELWVRATPEGEEVSLSLERWIYRPPAAPRLGTLVPHEQQVDLGGSPEEWAANEDLSIVSISAGLAEKLGTTVEEAIGKPLTRFLRLHPHNIAQKTAIMVEHRDAAEVDEWRPRDPLLRVQKVHEAMVEFLRTPHAQRYLWPHLKPDKRAEMLETVLREPRDASTSYAQTAPLSPGTAAFVSMSMLIVRLCAFKNSFPR